MTVYSKSTKSPFYLAGLWGFATTLPFVLLEYLNTRKFAEGFPFSVFTFMWILQTLFIFILVPTLNTIKSKKSLSKYSIGFFVRAVALALIAYVWTGWAIDQWPCFMGVPNCD